MFLDDIVNPLNELSKDQLKNILRPMQLMLSNVPVVTVLNLVPLVTNTTNQNLIPPLTANVSAVWIVH